jgi:hypothetical protein
VADGHRQYAEHSERERFNRRQRQPRRCTHVRSDPWQQGNEESQSRGIAESETRTETAPLENDGQQGDGYRGEKPQRARRKAEKQQPPSAHRKSETQSDPTVVPFGATTLQACI